MSENSKIPSEAATEAELSETMLDAPLSWAEQLELLPKRPRFDSEPIRATEAFQEPVRNFSDLLEGENKPLITASWPDSSGSEPLEADMTDVIRRHFSVENLPPANILRNRAPREVSAPMTQIAHAGGGSDVIPAWPGAGPIIRSAVDTETVIARNAKTKRITIIDDEPDVEASSAAVVQFPKTPTVERALDFALPSSSLRQQTASVLFVLFVPLVFAGILWGVGQTINSSPALVQSFFSLLQPPPASLPPPGVEIAGLRSEIITLDDGNQVLDITGQIVNSSNIDLRDVRLEASVFSAENQPLGTVQVASHTGLQPSQHITALPERTITELQSQLALGDSVIKPNAQIPFRIIITEGTESAAWFTARIYSVRPEVSNEIS